jgi:hypothetical protein
MNQVTIFLVIMNGETHRWSAGVLEYWSIGVLEDTALHLSTTP